MTLSRHAEIRAKQRGFPPLLIDIILACGRKTHAPGGAEKYVFGKREKARLLKSFKGIVQLMDKADGGTIITKDREILTVYKNG